MTDHSHDKKACHHLFAIVVQIVVTGWTVASPLPRGLQMLWLIGSILIYRDDSRLVARDQCNAARNQDRLWRPPFNKRNPSMRFTPSAMPQTNQAICSRAIATSSVEPKCCCAHKRMGTEGQWKIGRVTASLSDCIGEIDLSSCRVFEEGVKLGWLCYPFLLGLLDKECNRGCAPT